MLRFILFNIVISSVWILLLLLQFSLTSFNNIGCRDVEKEKKNQFLTSKTYETLDSLFIFVDNDSRFYLYAVTAANN